MSETKKQAEALSEMNDAHREAVRFVLDLQDSGTFGLILGLLDSKDVKRIGGAHREEARQVVVERVAEVKEIAKRVREAETALVRSAVVPA